MKALLNILQGVLAIGLLIAAITVIVQWVASFWVHTLEVSNTLSFLALMFTLNFLSEMNNDLSDG